MSKKLKGRIDFQSANESSSILAPGSCNILLKLLDWNHFFPKWFSGSQPDEGTQEILRKLEEPSAKQNVKTVQGGVLIDMENADTYGEIQIVN